MRLGMTNGRTLSVYLSLHPFATSRDRVKGTKESGGGSCDARLLQPPVPPIGPVFYDPVEQGLFKADVFAGLFAFDPLVLQNFFAFGQELLVKRRVLHE